jgi:uncharacterized membrane protein
MSYNYGVPGKVIWSVHIIVGLLLLYVGLMIVLKKEIHKYFGITLLCLGLLVISYHSHLWYKDNQSKSSKK